jgi:hypothetical protein
MKKYLFAALILTAGFAACGPQNKNDDMQNKDLVSTDLVHNAHSANGTDSAMFDKLPVMDFGADTVHDFGTIHEGEVVEYAFSFKNTGKQPLVISGATGSCGCTAPDYPKEPVAPGQTAVMNVKFHSAGKEGHQEKSVTINTNAKRGIYMLYIKADVIAENK